MADRLWYAVEAISFAPLGATTGYIAAKGVQSAGSNVRFNLEQVFQFGQSEIYENVERQPDVSVTVEKVLDGYPIIWHLATKGAVVGTLNGRSTKRCMIGMSFYNDVQDSASGTPIAQVVHSGMYPNSLSYNLNVNGPCTESVEFIGNDRTWGSSLYTSPTFDNTDSPLALASSGGVQFRENFLVGEASGNLTKVPTSIEGVTSSGTIQMVNGVPSVYLQTVRVQVNLNRQAVYALGKRGACHRYMTVPTPVETTFEVISKQGDGKNAYEEVDNTTNERIYLVMQEGTRIDCGTKNKLMSVNSTLGNAQGGGANAYTVSYQFSSYGTCTVSHPQDPSGL